MAIISFINRKPIRARNRALKPQYEGVLIRPIGKIRLIWGYLETTSLYGLLLGCEVGNRRLNWGRIGLGNDGVSREKRQDRGRYGVTGKEKLWTDCNSGFRVFPENAFPNTACVNRSHRRPAANLGFDGFRTPHKSGTGRTTGLL